jgi:hypothetical protein
LERLKSDPELARLHKSAVGWRKTRFAELMARESNRALYGRLLLAPPARLVRPEDAKVLMRFARPPDAT